MNVREFIEGWWLVLVIAGWFAVVAAVAMNDGWHRRPASVVEMRK